MLLERAKQSQLHIKTRFILIVCFNSYKQRIGGFISTNNEDNNVME